MAKLIVALGNPGIKYYANRHNIGWRVVDMYAEKFNLTFKSKFKGEYAQFQIQDSNKCDEQIIFLKPQTFMNLSGESVVPAMQFFKVDISDCLVIHDELDLNFGMLAFKNGGGSGGHNGLKSIVQHLGSDKFKRMRMGIGRPIFGDVSNWVLSNFPNEDISDLGKFITGACDALEFYLKNNYDRTASMYSRKTFF